MQTIITAEIGVNHNGSLDTLIAMLQMVSKVQIVTNEPILVKLQKRNPDLYSTDLYDSWLLGRRVPYCEHKRALELNLDAFTEADIWCNKLNLEWYCSCFDYTSLEFIATNFPHLRYWKIASPVTAEHLGLVEEICQQPGLKIMSTGMCNLAEMDRAVNAALKHARQEYLILMHCTSMYPTPNDHVNLAMIDTLKERYNLLVGYSSHDAGVPISVAAVAMGAVAIEKHITLDRSMKGPDQALSLEYRGLETLVKHIQSIEKAIGSPEKQLYEEELDVRKKVRITI